MVEFIDDQRGEHGVEPICKVLPIAPSTYYDHLAKRADPARLSDRARRDAVLRPEIERIFEENWRVYGVRKVWHQLDREGFTVARCTVARLMKGMGIQGIIRGKPHSAIHSMRSGDRSPWYVMLRHCGRERLRRQRHPPKRRCARSHGAGLLCMKKSKRTNRYLIGWFVRKHPS